MPRKTRKQYNKSRRTKKVSFTDQSIVLQFLQMLNTVKLYHWKTTSYAEHKATDELYSSLNGNIDKFVEVMLGTNENRVSLVNVHALPLVDFSNISDFKKEIENYKHFLNSLSNSLFNTDLLNIRDEILGDLNQFSYLLTFK
jgi:hypothetical protein